MKRTLIMLLIAISGISIKAQTVLSQDFESGTFPPTGWANIQGGSGNLWTTVSYGTTHGGTGAAEYKYSTTNAADAWLISSGVSLTAGTVYTITY